MIPQENGMGFLGNGEFPKIGVLKKGEPKTGMHNLVLHHSTCLVETRLMI
jgi:hypothetical protein